MFVNGTDIRDIEPAALFRKIGIVSQSPFLFSRTLAENIAMGKDGRGRTPRRRVKEAAELAGLAGDVASFPEGYGQMLGERGITLSGGQKQRAAIARALMKDSPVVILDDSLSSVDARTESTIIENLRRLKGGQDAHRGVPPDLAAEGRGPHLRAWTTGRSWSRARTRSSCPGAGCTSGWCATSRWKRASCRRRAVEERLNVEAAKKPLETGLPEAAPALRAALRVAGRSGPSCAW